MLQGGAARSLEAPCSQPALSSLTAPGFGVNSPENVGWRETSDSGPCARPDTREEAAVNPGDLARIRSEVFRGVFGQAIIVVCQPHHDGLSFNLFHSGG
jgi:hypothetical protein